MRPAHSLATGVAQVQLDQFLSDLNIYLTYCYGDCKTCRTAAPRRPRVRFATSDLLHWQAACCGYTAVLTLANQEPSTTLHVMMSKTRVLAVAIVALAAASRPAQPYAVFTHEAVIDSTWDLIKQVLLTRFPTATPADLKQAHAFAYGGCVIQDMGYYPMGSHYFSDLVHYVRSGDFVMALWRDAQNLNEAAFALGALAHYSSDSHGHPIGVNRAVALEYPALRSKYGDEVTYAEDPSVHLKTEFGFDVIQVAQGHYAPQDYHDFIGFQVSQELLERAFGDTYSIELQKQFKDLNLALGTYRRTVSGILPEATKLAWVLKRKEIVKARPGITKRTFLYNLSRASYEKEWGRQYEHIGFFQHVFAWVVEILPKVGPLKTLAFKPPTARTETLFMKSFNQTLDSYRASLRALNTGQLQLVNLDFDTGRPTRPGEYSLADETYAKLLRQLAAQDFRDITPELRANLMTFYQDPRSLQNDVPKRGKKERKDWAATMQALEKLRALTPPAPAAVAAAHRPT